MMMRAAVLRYFSPRRAVAIAVAAALLSVMVLPVKTAHATPSSPSTAIVSLGDSFISGEAGRWNGNALNPVHNRNGTDRAAYNCKWWGECDYDARRVYGSSFDNDCDRSDVAPIRSATEIAADLIGATSERSQPPGVEP